MATTTNSTSLKRIGRGNAMHRLEIGNVVLWFSYETLVAFRVAGNKLVITKNRWGVTTGRHLNEIDDDHSKRVDASEFDRLFSEQFEAKFENQQD